MSQELRWIEWSTRIQAIAQNGLAFSKDRFDIERYEELRQIAAEMLAAHTGIPTEFVRELFSGETGYATPKVDVRALVLREGRVLLVRERSDGGWTLPGGWADVCASPSENVTREVLEESGFQTRATRLLALHDRRKHLHAPRYPYSVYKLFILCEIMGGEATPGIETSDVDFFTPDDLPELSLDRVTPAQITRLFELAQHPEWPADFD